MNTTSIRRLSLLVALLPAAQAQAQVVYIATQRPAPYVPMSGGIQAFPFGAFDDALNVPIGFDFEYYGEVYTTVSITENGAISFQAPCSRLMPNACEFDEFCSGVVCERSFFPGPGRSGFPTPQPPTRLIAAYWSELLYDQGSNPASDVRFATVGAAPNRELVVEWRNMRSDVFGGGPQASRWTFQARLQEGTHQIRFHYGTFTPGQDAQFIRGYIGIQSQFAAESVAGASCTNTPNACTSLNLQQLQNQVIEIGRPTGPELTGRVHVVAGGAPGGQGVVTVTAQNLGLQATPGAFVADVYLALSTPIVPARDTVLGRVSFPALASGGSRTATVTGALPAGLAIGRYFVGAYIDADLQVAEATEANNIVVAPELMLVGADLSALIDATPVGAPGQPGMIVARVVNEAAPIASIAWRMYLSLDGALDGSDVELARGTTAAPSGATMVTASFTYPSAPPARYQILFVVDAEGAVAEVDELNNVGASPQFTLGPQLVARSVSAPVRTGPGETVALTALIESTGSGVPAVPYEVWLSASGRFDPLRDSRIAVASGAVGANVTASLTATGTVPAALLPGPYHLVLVVDPSNVIPELDEGDNIWVDPNTLTLSGPDISSVALSSAPIAFRGLPFPVSATFENVGGQTVTGARYSIHLSVNQLITVTDPIIDEGGPITLAPGERLTVMPAAPIRADMATGLYYVGVIADTDGAVTEQDESNNIRRNITQIVVRDVAPDFVATEIVAPLTAAAGERVTVQRLLENMGNAAGQLAYTIHLVPLRGRTEDGFVIGQGMISIAAGAAQQGVDVASLPPAVPAGDYEIEYQLDPTQGVDELDERNNVLRAETVVRVAQAQLEVLTKLLPVGALGVPYDTTLAATGGVGVTTWRVASGQTPVGLTLAPTGRLSGTPSAEAHARFTVEVTDGATRSTRALELLVVAGQADLALITRALPAAYAGQPYAYPLVAVGGIPPYTWSYEGELAPGFVLTSSGAVVGIAEAASPSRVLTFAVQDARGDVVERPLAFRVLDGSEGVRFGDGALPDGVVGDSYEAMVAVTGGEAPFTFEVGAGALPPGLTLDAGVVHGRPDRAGVYTVELRVADARGNVDLALFVVTISAPGELRFVTSGLPAGVVGQPYVDEGEQTVQLRVLAPAGSSSVSLSVLSGALPGGLAMSSSGQLTGTPSGPGVFAFVVLARDAEGRTARGAYGLAITAPVTIVPEPVDGSGCGCATTGRGEGALGACLALLGLLVWRRRQLGAGVVLAALLVVSTGAEAQRPPPIPPPVGFDGGVGNDAGVAAGNARYFLSTRTEAYLPRSGGTLVSFPGGIDDSATPIALPFPFHFYEQDYAAASIGTNGYLAFVGDASSLGNQSFPDGIQPNAVISPFWDDLYNPTVTTYVEGTAPARRFVIQWGNIERCCGAGQAFLNFQVHLFEGPAGRIELHYGAITGPGMEQFDASIGFEDATGARGVNLVACSPQCTLADFRGLGGTVLVALQDAGEDVFANALVPSLQGIGRVYPGVPFSVQARYASYHGEPIGPFVYRVHLLPQGSTTLDQPVYTSTAVTLSAYEVRDDRIEVTLPLTVPPGRYRLALQVDADGDITEPDENNNVSIAAQELIVAEPAPNFTVSDVTWVGAQPAAPGASGTVRFSLANAGNLSGTASYRVVLSGNPVASIDDVTLVSGSLALELLDAQPVESAVMLPAGLRGGVYWLGVVVDPEDAVVELSEIDNTAVSDALEVRSGPLAIVTRALPPAYRGLEYSAALVADGVGVESWSVTAGRTPDGVTLSPGGILFGRPTALGTETFTATVRAADGSMASQALTLEVRDGAGPLVIVTRQILPGVVGQAYPPSAAGVPVAQQQHLVVSGGAGPATFRLTRGAPDGLVLDADGYLHGTTSRRGMFELEVEAVSGGETARATLTLQVVDVGRLTLVPQALEPAIVSDTYDVGLVVVGAVEPANVELTLVNGAGGLPDGLSLSRQGALSGTPTQVGRFTFVVRATEAIGARVVSDTASFELEVRGASGFAITPGVLPDATVGIAYRAVLEARLGRAPFAWGTIDARRLPRGLHAAVITDGGAEKLEITGTPEEVPTDAQIGDRTGGVSTLRVTVTDAGGQVAEAAYALRVVAMPAPAPPTTEDGGCSCASAAAPVDAPLLLLLALVWARRRRSR